MGFGQAMHWFATVACSSVEAQVGYFYFLHDVEILYICSFHFHGIVGYSDQSPYVNQLECAVGNVLIFVAES